MFLRRVWGLHQIVLGFGFPVKNRLLPSWSVVHMDAPGSTSKDPVILIEDQIPLRKGLYQSAGA